MSPALFNTVAKHLCADPGRRLAAPPTSRGGLWDTGVLRKGHEIATKISTLASPVPTHHPWELTDGLLS